MNANNTMNNIIDDTLAITYQVDPLLQRHAKYSRHVRQSKRQQEYLLAWLDDCSGMTDAQLAKAFKVAWKSQ